MRLRYLATLALLDLTRLFAQKPTINPGGIVNAASFATGIDIRNGVVGQGLDRYAIASIFGTNLASATASATATPLPTQLGGTSVLVDGVAAPLFFVSPGQINFQNPATSNSPTYVVTTADGSSAPYALDGIENVGIFSQDGSGCGPGSILNVAADGSTSLNSRSNSVSPGTYVSYFATGLGFVTGLDQPLGVPVPIAPLVPAIRGGATIFDLSPNIVMANNFQGFAPGYVGLDLLNVQIPASVPEGCAVPLQFGQLGGGYSQPVTMSVRNGGGACVDPPPGGFGDITWQKTTTTTTTTTTAQETLTASLQSSPGMQAPPLPTYRTVGGQLFHTNFGPSCPIPGYRSLDAGKTAIQGPGLAPTAAPSAPFAVGQIGGLAAYQATLPSGSIAPGTFTFSAAGGADVGAFQSSVAIGSDIQISTLIAGQAFPVSKTPIVINWTGGDQNSWVTVTAVNHFGIYDYGIYMQVQASAGTMKFGGFAGYELQGSPAEIIVEVTPDPSSISTFSAPGLTLGGRHSWKYTHKFENVILQ